MSAVGTHPVSPDNPLRERVAAALRAAAVRRHHPGALPRGAARGHGRAAGRGRRDRRRPTSRRRSTTPSWRSSGRAGCWPGRRRCSATSPRRCPRRGCGRSSGRSPRSRPRTRTRSGSTRRCSPGSTPCTPARHDAGLDDGGGAAGRALPPGLRAGRRAARRRRPRAAARSSTRSSRRCRRRSGRTSSWPREAAAVAGRRRRRARRAATPRRSPRPPRPPPTAGVDGLPARPAAAHRPAGARQAAQPRRCAGGCTRPRSTRASSGEHDNRPVAGAHRAAAGGAGPAARVRHPRRPRRWPTRPPAPPRRSTRCWPRWCPASVANAEAEAAVLRRGGRARRRRAGRRGTGRSTASRCGPSGTPSTPPRCGRTSSWTGCCTTASSTPPSCSTATASPRGPTSPATTPTSGSGRSATPTATAVGLFLGDFFAREAKRGGAWMSSFVRQSRLLGTRPVVVNNLNVSRAAGGPADAADPRRGQHAVPRVRARAARAVLGGHLPALLRHQRAARLRRVPQPGQRDVGAVAGGPRQLRPARRDRRAAAGRRRRGDRRRAAVGRGLRHHRVPRPRRCSTRRGTASRPTPRSATRSRSSEQALERRRRRVRAGAAALPDDLLPAHLRGRLRGRLLLLHLVRGARRRHRGVVQGERRPAPGERRRVPAASCSPSAARSTRWPPSAPSAAGTPTPARCCGAAASPPPDAAAPALRVLARALRGSCSTRRSREQHPRGRSQARSQPGQLQHQVQVVGASPSRTSRLGWRWPHTVQRCTTCQPLPDFSTSPIGSIGRLALARPVARQLVDVQRPQAVRAVVAVVPVGVGGHRRRAVDADEAGVLRPPGAAHASGQGTNGSMPTTSTLMSRPLGAW